MRPYVLLTLALAACGSPVVNNPGTKPDDTDTADVGDVPAIELSAESYDFGDIHYGVREVTAVTVYNRGGAPLVIASLVTESPFSVSPTTLTIQPSSSQTITIAVQPTGYQDYVGTLTFTSDDPDQPVLDFGLLASVITDEDGDGYVTEDAGGDDCDDEDADVNPGVTETWYDGIDQDCDGASDYDQDYDGYETDAYNDDPARGGGDCQDINPDYNPGAVDTPYDNRDTNCDGSDDYDADGDGYRALGYGSGSDCDDFDPDVNIEGTETLNGKDDDCDGTTDQGGYAEGADRVYVAPSAYDRIGYALAAGDFDGDGADDLVIGAPYEGATSPSAAGRGAIGVMQGGSRLPPSGAAADEGDNWFRGAGTSDLLGAQLAVVGDYDGDGELDVAIAATGVSSNAGAVYLVSGRDLAGGYDYTDAHTTFTGSSSNQYLGRGIASDVDLDGDGLAEAALAYASGSSNYLALDYGGSSTGTVSLTAMDALFSTDGVEVAFYRNAPIGGDLDGDGYDDLVLADGKADFTQTDSGAVWALWGQASRYSTGGSATDIENHATVVISGDTTTDYAGWSATLGDDWDGDGDVELWTYTSGQGMYVLEGGTARYSRVDPSDAYRVFYDWGDNDTDAEMIRPIGDWTGDGLTEMMVFHEDASGGMGDNTVLSSEIRSGDWAVGTYAYGTLGGSSTYGNANVGYGIAPVPGDFDGDGDTDVLLGDPEFDSNSGEVYVFFNSLVD